MKNFIINFTLVLAVIIGFSFHPSNKTWDEKEAIVSYYGSKFHGKLTASGEPFNMHAFTCAHKSLKFGTKVQFTNPKNGKTIVVKVNDRGPYIKGRTFDLSRAAFDSIADIDRGVVKLRYKILN